MDDIITLENASSCLPMEELHFKRLGLAISRWRKRWEGMFTMGGGGRIRWKWIRPQQHQQQQ